MADHLTKGLGLDWHRSSRALGVRVVWAICALFSFSAFSEELLDPTRPPEAVYAPADGGGVERPEPAGLQSVIISKSRSAAVIDGQTIELGGKYGDVRLIEVNDTGVILQGAHEKQVMELFPGVSMTKKKVKAGP